MRQWVYCLMAALLAAHSHTQSLRDKPGIWMQTVISCFRLIYAYVCLRCRIATIVWRQQSHGKDYLFDPWFGERRLLRRCYWSAGHILLRYQSRCSMCYRVNERTSFARMHFLNHTRKSVPEHNPCTILCCVETGFSSHKPLTSTFCYPQRCFQNRWSYFYPTCDW